MAADSPILDLDAIRRRVRAGYDRPGGVPIGDYAYAASIDILALTREVDWLLVQYTSARDKACRAGVVVRDLARRLPDDEAVRALAAIFGVKDEEVRDG